MPKTAKARPDSEDPEFLAAVREGIASLDAGKGIPYEKIRCWLLSWGTEKELPPPD
jgi:predicted transcriptional regulator